MCLDVINVMEFWTVPGSHLMMKRTVHNAHRTHHIVVIVTNLETLLVKIEVILVTMTMVRQFLLIQFKVVVGKCPLY